MKGRVLGNKGVTLIELIVAAVILGIIAVPLLNTVLEVTKSTVKSDIELKMNAEVQKVIEEIKAKGEYPDQVVYYDKLFRGPVSAANAFYRMDISVDKNNVDSSLTSASAGVTDANFDRWDYELSIYGIDTDENNCYVSIKKNSGVRLEGSGKFRETDLSYSGTSLDGAANKLTLDIIKNSQGKYKLSFERYQKSPDLQNIGEESWKDLITDNGHLQVDNSIVIRVVKDKDKPDIPQSFVLNLDIKNSTNDSGAYSKYIIVNVEDIISNKVEVKPLSPYIDINKNFTVIEDQYEVSCKVTRIGNGENLTMKHVKSTIGKPVKLGSTP